MIEIDIHQNINELKKAIQQVKQGDWVTVKDGDEKLAVIMSPMDEEEIEALEDRLDLETLRQFREDPDLELIPFEQVIKELGDADEL
ncbi:MAG: hypothetical protein HQM15_09510 [Deltaproteobacteria bacterium]|nr:hypothetical protein [Deltaproteobacteria bacterium]